MKWSGGLAVLAVIFFAAYELIAYGYLQVATLGGVTQSDLLAFGVLATIAAIAFAASEKPWSE